MSALANAMLVGWIAYSSITLENYKICNEATIYLRLRLRGGANMFTDITQEAKKYEWNKSAPDWRIAHKGLCLEGRCKNEKCKAFNKMVVINMGVTIFKLGILLFKVLIWSNSLISLVQVLKFL